MFRYGRLPASELTKSLILHLAGNITIILSWATVLAHVKLGLRATMAGSSQVVMLPWKMAAATGALSCSVLLLWNSGVTFA